MNSNELPRRVVLRTLLLGAAGAAVAGCGGGEQPAAGSAAAPTEPAAAPPPSAAAPTPAPAAAPAPGGAVDPSEPQAQSLGYVLDANQVDPKANPMYQPGQKCSNCVQYQGPADAFTAPCTIFAGRIVAGPGWCKVWAKKPA